MRVESSNHLKKRGVPKSHTSRKTKPLYLMQYFMQALRNYADIKGRARRSEYWYFTLFYILLSFLTNIIDFGMGFTYANGEAGVLSTLLLLFLIIPSFTVGVRRLHDVGKSGWMVLISLIPIIGWIWIIILVCKDSQPGSNKWGPNPKEAELFENSFL